MAQNESDPLAALISNDAKTTDRKKLSELLQPFVEIDGNSKELRFLSAFVDMKGNNEKIEIILAAAKARALLFDMTDGMLPKELIELGMLAEGSVKTSIRKLSSERKIRKDKNGRYLMPSHRIPELLKHFSAARGE